MLRVWVDFNAIDLDDTTWGTFDPPAWPGRGKTGTEVLAYDGEGTTMRGRVLQSGAGVNSVVRLLVDRSTTEHDDRYPDGCERGSKTDWQHMSHDH